MRFKVKTRTGEVGYSSHTHKIMGGWLIVSPTCNPSWVTSAFPRDKWLCVKEIGND